MNGTGIDNNEKKTLGLHQVPKIAEVDPPQITINLNLSKTSKKTSD